MGRAERALNRFTFAPDIPAPFGRSDFERFSKRALDREVYQPEHEARDCVD